MRWPRRCKLASMNAVRCSPTLRSPLQWSFPTFPFCNSCTVSSLHTPFQYRVTPTTESIISYIEIYLSKQAFVKSVDEIVGKMFYTFNEYILNWDAVSETWLTKHSIHGCFDVIMKAVHHGRCRFRGADMFFTGFCEKEAMVIKKVERKGPFRFYAETPTLDLLSPIHRDVEHFSASLVRVHW